MADYYLNKTAARIDYLLEKVEGIEAGAEVNQNAVSSVIVNGTTVSAGSKTDSIELIAGSNVTLTADSSNKTVTVSAIDTTYSDATTETSGLMSSSDKTKLNGIASGAEVNQNAFGNVVANGTTISASSKTDNVEIVAGTNVTVTANAANKTVTITATDTTYSDATTETSGLMSSSDKTKLNGIASGAEVNVQSDWNQENSEADDYIKNKPTIPAAQVNSDWSANSGVAQILNKPVVDSAPTASSTNLVESGGVYTALSSKQATLVVGTNLDNVPTNNSDNPVTSGGVYTGLAAKVNLSDIPTEAQIDAMFS